MQDLQLIKLDQARQLRRKAAKIKKTMNEKHCYFCEEQTDFLLAIHHIIPIAKDGDNMPNNLIILCYNCHKLIHAMISANEKMRVKALCYFFEKGFKNYKEKFNYIIKQFKYGNASIFANISSNAKR